jgi:hypothetical protein
MRRLPVVLRVDVGAAGEDQAVEPVELRAGVRFVGGEDDRCAAGRGDGPFVLGDRVGAGGDADARRAFERRRALSRGSGD